MSHAFLYSGITYVAPTTSTGGPVRPGTGSTGYIAPPISEFYFPPTVPSYHLTLRAKFA